MGPTCFYIQFVLVSVSPGIKLPRGDVNHTPPSGTGVLNECSSTSTLPYASMAWYLIKYGGKFRILKGIHLVVLLKQK